jgi:proteasome lid subunit RPN8/RPN11
MVTRATLVSPMKKAPEIFLSPTAFLGMSVAAVEVYPKETVGILIGIRGGDKIWVEYAVPIQTAKRDEDSVSWKRHVEDRIKRFMTGSTNLEIVGSFHSHPWADHKALFKGMNRLSEADREGWDSREIQIVAGLVKNGGVDANRRRLEWQHLRGGTLQGAIGDYAMKMTAWYAMRGVIETPGIAFIRCAFATGMDR